MGMFSSRVGSWWTLKQDDDEVNFTLVAGRAFGLRFNYDLIEHVTGTRTPIQYTVEITTTRPHFGGCRHCYDLTYRTCQTHNKRLDTLRRDPEALLAALRSDNYRQSFLGVKACIYGLGRLQGYQR